MIRLCAAALFVACVVQPLGAAEPRALEYEVVLVRLKSTQRIVEADQPLTGTAIRTLIPQWREKGLVERLTTVRTSALENLPASVQLGEEKAITIGRSFSSGRGGPGGGAGGFNPQSVFQVEQTGTIVKVTGAIVESGEITVELTAEETAFDQTNDSVPVAIGSAADATPAPSPVRPTKSTTSARTTIKVKPGEPALVGGSWNERTTGTVTTYEGYLIVLTAKTGNSTR